MLEGFRESSRSILSERLFLSCLLPSFFYPWRSDVDKVRLTQESEPNHLVHNDYSKVVDRIISWSMITEPLKLWERLERTVDFPHTVSLCGLVNGFLKCFADRLLVGSEGCQQCATDLSIRKSTCDKAYCRWEINLMSNRKY